MGQLYGYSSTSTSKEAPAVPAGVAYELSLLSCPVLTVLTGSQSSGPLEH